jgi:hypothetical protein
LLRSLGQIPKAKAQVSPAAKGVATDQLIRKVKPVSYPRITAPFNLTQIATRAVLIGEIQLVVKLIISWTFTGSTGIPELKEERKSDT